MKAVKFCAGLAALVLAASLAGCGRLGQQNPDGELRAEDNLSGQIFETGQAAEPEPAADFVRAVWVSYLDLYDIISADESRYRQKLDDMLANLETIRATDLFFQVRAFGESLYGSEIFPLENRLFSSFDPQIDYLGIAVEAAHAHGMRIHAWVNPFRLGAASDPSTAAFCERVNAGSPGAAVEVEGRMWIDPSNAAMRELNLAYIAELLGKYAFDGLHFDDYFYPTDEPWFDETAYAQYTAAGGEQPLAQWRLENVRVFVKAVYDAVKAARPEAVFGISPDGSIERNMSRHFLDVQTLCTQPGYLDYICPQVYFGYENETMPFLQTVTAWSQLSTACELLVGLSFYKAGAADAYAGSGQDEWLQSTDIISRQTADSLELTNCKGIALFRYNSIFNPVQETAAFAQLELYNFQKLC